MNCLKTKKNSPKNMIEITSKYGKFKYYFKFKYEHNNKWKNPPFEDVFDMTKQIEKHLIKFVGEKNGYTPDD